MTFGEKLQALRKGRGLSQEQMAEMLNVSRQAVSKWELNTSMPEAEKIVELSRMFSVSTDYLLKEEMEHAEGTMPSSAADRSGQDGFRRRAVLLGCLGAMIAGALFCWAAWWTWQTALTYSVGLMVELAAWLVFEILLGREKKAARRQQRMRFYMAAVWLLALPVYFLAAHFLWLPHGFRLALFPATLLLCICISVSCYRARK